MDLNSRKLTSVTNKQVESIFNAIALIVNNNHTDIVYTEFDNKIVLVVTQFKKIGSLHSVLKLQGLQNEETEYSYEVNPLLGSNENDLFASRFIAEGVTSTKQLLIFCTLKDHSKETLLDIKSAVSDLIAKITPHN